MKTFVILLIAGIVAATGVLATAPAADLAHGWGQFTPRDILLTIGAFFGPAASFFGVGAIAKSEPRYSNYIPAVMLAGVLGFSGCTPTGHIGGHYDATTNTWVADVGIDFKGQIEQAIKDEKALIASEQTSYNAMTAAQKKAHDEFKAAHRARLKKLEAGVWVDPIPTTPATAPSTTTGSTNTPIVFPPVELPEKGVTWGVFFGKNKYPGAPLRGCVNDIHDVIEYCTETRGLDAAHTIVLFDEQATTEAEKAALTKTVSLVRPIDKFIWWDSGHGAEYPGADGVLHYVTCPIDFDWTEEHMLMDTQIKEILSKLPAGTTVFVGNHGSDTCFSGVLDKDKLATLKPGDTPKTFPHMPAPLVQRLDRIKRTQAFQKREFISGELNIGFISGCGPAQTSADTVDENGRPCGAMTHYFLKTIRQPGNDTKPISELVRQMNLTLASDGYEQRPQVEGARKDKPFLK